jgi:hypothetical protein
MQRAPGPSCAACRTPHRSRCLHRKGGSRAPALQGTCRATRATALTYALWASNLIRMHLAKPILLAAMVVALVVYTFDCVAVTTPEMAARCCDSMPCASQGHHGQDCCETMPSMHAPFVQPSSGQGVSFSTVVIAVLPASDEPNGMDSSVRVIAARGHAPPILYAPVPLPLRI